ncbi:MAG: hypothetical protein BHV88_22810 [Clostridiales bacterium 41_12_two_minus]|nr:MAG: hypothetical protein BHV88_22810 [Clostridiales bacterium 41_12_two_minus]
MYALADIKQYRENTAGTDLVISVSDMKLGDMIRRKGLRYAELRFDDGRHISVEQRKKAYATIRDIADWAGYLPEEMKEHLKYEHMIRTGDAYFSLSNCSMDTAREFINTILEFSLENGVPLSEDALNRTDDIGRYLYYCIMHRKCAICGRDGEIHHEDAVGMGNNRNRIDDSSYRKICLCRKHHTVAHQMGVKRFREMYKVYGITVKDM